MKQRFRFILPPHKIILACAIALGLVIIRYVSLIPSHFHHDEFVLAYTSYTLPAFSRIDWFAGYPKEWINQFSILIFILQKPFFLVFGPTMSAIRLSALLYFPFVCIVLYLLGKRLFSSTVGIIAVFLYAVFAPSMYLWSIGSIELASSTLVYIATLYPVFTFLSSRHARHAILAGAFGALGFLTQPNSYAALPVALFIWGIEWVITRKSYIVYGIIKAVTTAGILLSPFVWYAITVNNFFFQRVSQVNIFTGSWNRGTVDIGQQLIDATTALFQPNIGGALGYHFGKQALFEPITAGLFLIGFLLLITRRSWYVIIALVIPFLGGMVFTMPPPAFHRIALLFPLIALVCAITIELILRRFSFSIVGMSVVVLVISIAAVSNIRHLRVMLREDAKINPQYMRVIGDFINRSYPAGTPVTIAAPQSFKIQEELFFRTSGKYPIRTVEEIDGAAVPRDSPLIIFEPLMEEREQLTAAFPQRSWISTLEGVPLADPYGQLLLFVEK